MPDEWCIDQLGKLLQIWVAEVDRLLMAAEFEPQYGTPKPPPATPVTPSQTLGKQLPQPMKQSGVPSSPAHYNFSGDFRGSIINVNCWMEGVVQITGTKAGYWTPPPLETLFFAPHHQEKAHFLDAYQHVQENGRGKIVLLTGKPGSGRHALVKWLSEQTAVSEQGIYSAKPQSTPVAASMELLDKTHQNAPAPTLFIIENLKQDESWQNELSALAQEIVQGEEALPVLLVVTLTTRIPNDEQADKNSPAHFAHTLQQEKLGELIELGSGHLSYQDIENGIDSDNTRLAGRLYELTNGDLYWSEVVWKEWTDAVGRGVEKDDMGQWQAVPSEHGDLTIYASVARQASHQLANHLSLKANGTCPYTQSKAEEILQCAATEGQGFTAEAVANVLQLEKDELRTFFNKFLQPDVDKDNPEQEMPGIVAQGDAIQIDPQRPDSIVVEYKFTRPYLYYAWRKHPPLKEKRKLWKASLAQALIRLYQPYETMISEKLGLLAPHLAEPYRQRQQQQIYLQQLRHQTASLLDTREENHYATYRLFDIGTKLLDLLASNASYAEEGINLAQTMYERALFWQDAAVEARIARYWGCHLHNMGQYIEALPLYKRAVHLCETENLDQLLYATSLNSLGALLQAMGQYAEALPFYERALAIREAQLGPQHPDTATSLGNLGGLLRAMGQYAEARPFYERALAIREEQLGPQHPDTARSLNNLAILSYYIGDKAEAARLMQQALVILEAALGAKHPNTQTCRQSLAVIQSELNS